MKRSEGTPKGISLPQDRSPDGLATDQEAVARALAKAYRLLLTAGGNRKESRADEGAADDSITLSRF